MTLKSELPNRNRLFVSFQAVNLLRAEGGSMMSGGYHLALLGISLFCRSGKESK